MIPISFPKELSTFFQDTSDLQEKELTSLFEKNPKVLQTFITWSENHMGVVQNTPRLYKAFTIATGQTKTINDLK